MVILDVVLFEEAQSVLRSGPVRRDEAFGMLVGEGFVAAQFVSQLNAVVGLSKKRRVGKEVVLFTDCTYTSIDLLRTSRSCSSES